MNPAFGEIGESLRRSTVQVRDGREGCGSGVIWSSGGLIVTNAHVIRGRNPTVELWDGRTYRAELRSRDGRRDLASLSIAARQITPVAAGDSDRLRAGELVIAIGNPMGFTGALSTGVVHASGPVAGLGRRSWVQAGIRLAPGNSGGPLADACGRVVGINSMVVSGGLALAVPVSTVQRFLLSGPAPELGVTIQQVRMPRLKGVGLLLTDLVSGGAAEQASLRAGDVLIAANGRPFHSPDDLCEALDQSAGAAISIEFIRGEVSRKRAVSVRLNPGLAA